MPADDLNGPAQLPQVAITIAKIVGVRFQIRVSSSVSAALFEAMIRSCSVFVLSLVVRNNIDGYDEAGKHRVNRSHQRVICLSEYFNCQSTISGTAKTRLN
jgi:hypothetical protein